MGPITTARFGSDGQPSTHRSRTFGCPTLPLLQQALESCPNLVRMTQLALPDGDHRPTEAAERGGGAAVAFGVAIELRFPEFPSRCRHRGVPAPLMAVSEASVDKDHRLEPWQDQIGPARQPLVVQAEPAPEAVDERRHREPRCRVLAASAGHEGRAGGWREDVAMPARYGHDGSPA